MNDTEAPVRPHRVLLTNDDGITAPGLIAMIRHLLKRGVYELRVAAPSKQQSGVSHCITLWTPVTCEQYSLPGDLSKITAWKVDGTPADCVKMALTAVYKDWKPDMVISGINLGLNTGRSVIYSGTVGAAMEAAVNQIPSVAISIDMGPDHRVDPNTLHWDCAAFYCAKVIDTVLETGIPKGSFLNVNVPNQPQGNIKGIRLTKQGTSAYNEYFKEVTKEGDTNRTFVLRGSFEMRDKDMAYDSYAVSQGYISVTPLGLYFHTEDQQAIIQSYEKWKLFH